MSVRAGAGHRQANGWRSSHDRLALGLYLIYYCEILPPICCVERLDALCDFAKHLHDVSGVVKPVHRHCHGIRDEYSCTASHLY